MMLLKTNIVIFITALGFDLTLTTICTSDLHTALR